MALGALGGRGAKEGLAFLLVLTQRVAEPAAQPTTAPGGTAAPASGSRPETGISPAGEPRPLWLPPDEPRSLGSGSSRPVPTTGWLARGAWLCCELAGGPRGQWNGKAAREEVNPVTRVPRGTPLQPGPVSPERGGGAHALGVLGGYGSSELGWRGREWL